MRIGFAALLFLALGCSDPVTTTTAVKASRTELASTGWGTVRGVVRFDGTPPARPRLDTGSNPHREHCQSDDLIDETWVIDPATKVLANTVISLEAPEGQYFPRQPADRKTWPQTVILDQPKCMFEPHVLVIYPEYYEPSKNRLVSTGQSLLVRNSSAVPHEAAFVGGSKNPRRGEIIPGKKPGGVAPELPVILKVDSTPIAVTCSLHKWMSGYILAFEHPYAGISGRDGRFELKNVPAGAKVRVRAWHEAGEVIIPEAQREITVPNDGEVVLDLLVKPR